MGMIEFSAQLTTFLIVIGKLLLALFGVCVVLGLIIAIIFEIQIIREENREGKDEKHE